MWLALAAGVALLVAAPAQGAFPGSNGRIAFIIAYDIIDGSNDLEIWTVKSDGSGFKHVTHSPGEDRSPAYSASGSKIVWERDGDIWKMDSDGSNKKQLTGATPTETDDDRTPSFSPSGKVVFVRTSGGTFEMIKMNGDGSNKDTIKSQTAGGFETPAWSPNGNWIAYATNDGGVGNETRLAKIRSDGTDDTPLGDAGIGAQAPDWSPGGGRIIHQAVDGCAAGNAEDIMIMNADGSDQDCLLGVGPHDPAYPEYRPVFSPDGKKFALAASYDGTFDIWKTPVAEFPSLTNLTSSFFGSYQEDEPSWQPR